MEKSRSLSIAVKGLFVSAFFSTIFGVANASAYTVTYNANGALFDNGQETNIVEYDDNHNVVSGEYKDPVLNNPTSFNLYWSKNQKGTEKVEDLATLSEDTNLYAIYTNIVWDFSYTGDIQTFTSPITRKLKLETWGAQGGNTNAPTSFDPKEGGYGAYATGFYDIELNKNYYVVVGGQPELETQKRRSYIWPGGYNGGGNGATDNNARVEQGGGGATHIATVSGVLSELEQYKGSLIDNGDLAYYESNEIIIVSAGGTGVSYAVNSNSNGESGGGYRTRGAGQSSGYQFGQGQIYTSVPGTLNPQGGGGGFFGGTYDHGGSSYIANPKLKYKYMASYNTPYTSNQEQIKTISVSLANEDAISDVAKKGNGAAKISYVSHKVTVINNFDGKNVSYFVGHGETTTPEDYALKPGYSFAWYLGDNEFDFSAPITEDIELVGKYTPIVYSLSYDLGIGVLSESNPSSYTIETDDITLNNPNKDYYTFLGWSGTGLTGNRNKTVTIAKGSTGDRDYTANYTPIPYTITYNLDGGTNGTNNPTAYTYESDEITLARPTKEGYSFLGWSGTDIDGENNLDVTIPVQSHGDREYTAHWSINQYTATFDVNGGSAIDPSTITSDYGVAFGTLPETSRTGYNFDGWFTGQTDGDEISSSTTMPAGNTTYYAHWTIQAFNISYDLNGGELAQGASNPDTYTYDSADINLAKPSRVGYTFLGWSGTDLTDNTEDVTIAHNSLGDRSYKAEFQINEYTATFDANAGETANPETITKNYNEEFGNLPATSRLGYKFLGWFTDATAGDEITDTTKMPAGDVTYYAHWEIITYTIEYDLGGEDMDSAPTNDTSNPTSYTVEDADITLKAATPGDTWHYFVGWALDRDSEDGLTGNFVIDTAETKNIKVYAIFQANPYTVTLDPGNGDDEIVKIVRGDQEIGELPTPERAGYEFLGWFVGDKQIDEHFHPRSDAVVVARWAEILTVPDTGANSTSNTGDAIMNYIVTFAVCAFALFIVVALCKRKAKNELCES